MLVAEMYDEIRGCFGGKLSNTTTWSDAALLTRLNRAYRYRIPGKVPGVTTEGTWEFDTVASQGDYPFVEWVYQPRSSIFLDEQRLRYHTRPSEFYSWYDLEDLTESRPSGSLFYGRTVTLRNIPDAIYPVVIHVRRRPDAFTTELADENMAMACVYGAVSEISKRLADTDTQQRFEDEFKDKVHDLKVESMSRPTTKRRKRTW